MTTDTVAAAPRRQSLLRSQARCALLPAATPRMRAFGRRLHGLAKRRQACCCRSGGRCWRSGWRRAAEVRVDTLARVTAGVP